MSVRRSPRSSTKAQASPPSSATVAKPDIPARNFAVLCAINALFTTLAVCDLSVDLYALADPSRLSFLGPYYTWRDEAPIVSHVMLLLISPLPAVLFILMRDSLGWLFGWRTASGTRHAADVIQLCTLCLLILPAVALRQWPAQKALKAGCTPAALVSAAAEAHCADLARAARPVHSLLVVTNLIMTVTDCMKYIGNGGGEAPSRARKKVA
jgi:hypothetical protein